MLVLQYEDGWSYCDVKSQKAMLPYCECMDIWTYQEPDTDCTDSRTPVRFRGCPTSDELSTCEKDTDPWCMTKDFKCFEQNSEDGNVGDQWVYCNPETQLAVLHPHVSSMLCDYRCIVSCNS